MTDYDITSNPAYEWLSEILIVWRSIDCIPIGMFESVSDVWLLLDRSYRHPLDDSQIPAHIRICTHERNCSYGPSDRPFCIWRNDGLGFVSLRQPSLITGIPLNTSCPQIHVLPVRLEAGMSIHAPREMEPGRYLANIPTIDLPSTIVQLPRSGEYTWDWPCMPHWREYELVRKDRWFTFSEKYAAYWCSTQREPIYPCMEHLIDIDMSM